VDAAADKKDAVAAPANSDADLLKQLDDFVGTSLPPEKIVENMKMIRKESRAILEWIIGNIPTCSHRDAALASVQVTMTHVAQAMLMPIKQFEKPKENL